MSKNALGKADSSTVSEGKELPECPTCARTDFKSLKGMRQHHKRTHGESIAKTTLECDGCGSEFKRWKSQLDGGGTFCSPECHLEDHNGKGSDSPRYNTITVQCAYCDEGVERCLSRVRRVDNIYCSRDCADKDHSDRVSNDGNPNYRHGESVNYGPNWQEQRRKALERDGYECLECGLDQREHYEKYGRALNVHHIARAVTFDSHEKANRLSNLETYCQRCHVLKEHNTI